MKLLIFSIPFNILLFPISFLFPNINLRILLWNILHHCSSLRVRNQDSHTYKTTGKIILIFTLLGDGKTNYSQILI